MKITFKKFKFKENARVNLKDFLEKYDIEIVIEALPDGKIEVELKDWFHGSFNCTWLIFSADTLLDALNELCNFIQGSCIIKSTVHTEIQVPSSLYFVITDFMLPENEHA